MKTFTTLLLLFFFLSGCAHKTVSQDLSHRTLTFPYGSYQHKVKVEIRNGSYPEKRFEFNGVVLLGSETIKVVGLSPLNSTLFRLTEDRKSEKLEVEIFVEQLKKSEEQIRKFYAVIKKMMLSPYEEQNTQRVIDTPYGPARVQFDKFDKNKIPNLVVVFSSSFNISVEVVGYEI